ncbi:MAG TPA: FAD:protein FMN transferase [Acidimicrobiia bacterium]|nr:FAD:protein FMN transferase [Acidimicrobiia bacterium]
MPADAFRAMGSDASIVVVGGPRGLVTRARARIDELESLWSRFLPHSEVSRLNAAAGQRPLLVAPETFELVRRGVDAWRITDGLFDPTVLGDVLRAGYTTSFDQLPSVTGASVSRLGRGCAGIELDPSLCAVRLPAGVGFDPGGIGKGLAADLVVDELLAAGAAGACVNLGGDVRVAGTPPDASWAVAIDHPTRPEPVAVAHLAHGAVATSSRLTRRWETDRGFAHHLIDPRRGTPADAPVWTATAVAATGWQAEVLAKAAFLADLGPGLDLLDRRGAAGLLIDEDGAVLTTRSFAPFVDLPARLAQEAIR